MDFLNGFIHIHGSEGSGELPQLRYPANEKFENEQKGPMTSNIHGHGLSPINDPLFQQENSPYEPTQSTRDLGSFPGI